MIKKFIKGFTDFGRLFNHLDKTQRAERRAQWLKEHTRKEATQNGVPNQPPKPTKEK